MNNHEITINQEKLLNLKNKIITGKNKINKTIEEDCNTLRKAFINLIDNDLENNYYDNSVISEHIKLNIINSQNFRKECKINTREIEDKITQTIGYNVHIGLVDIGYSRCSRLYLTFDNETKN